MAEPLQLPFGSREERVAYNESWARDLNRARAEWQGAGSEIGFRCECERTECDARIDLTPSDWAAVRSRPSRFAVVPDHASSTDIETVVARHEGFWIVEKHGEAGKVAEQLA